MRAQSWSTAIAVATFFSAAVLSSFCLAKEQAIRLGTLAGPGSQVGAVLKDATDAGALRIDVVTFDDPSALARELADGKIDIAELPSTHYLEKETAAHKYEFAVVAHTITLPTGIYSRSLASLQALKAGDTIAIPQAPLERARALILLQNSGLLRLKADVSAEATLADISENPKELRFVEKGPAELAASFKTSAAAVIPFHEAAKSNLNPARDALVSEDGHSPYAQILVVKTPNSAATWTEKLVSVYRSEKIKTFILTQFNGAVRRPW